MASPDRNVATCLMLAAAIALAAAVAITVSRAQDGGSAPWNVPEAQKSVRNPVPANTESIARGKDLYTKNCLACHGATGDGKGPVAQRLGFAAGDLTDAEEMAEETDGEIFWKIATGRDPMPSFKKDKGFADAQIWDVVNFVRTLSRGAQTKPRHR